MKKNYSYLLLLLLICAAQGLNAQQLRAVFYNPTGADNGYEYVEIEHTPSTALTGLTFLVIEGDGTAQGTIDKAIDLSTYSTGTNGLLLWRDAATVLSPAPSPATSVVVNDFTPDLENGTNTYMIVSGFTGTQGTDYDANNDGVLDSTPWTSVLSAVSVTDGGSSDALYAFGLGGVNLSMGTPHGFVLSNNSYYAVTVSGSSPGPYSVSNAWDSSGTSNAAVAATILHPGNTTSPLPILLQKFEAVYQQSHVQLQWTTSEETNLEGFVLEHSTNGIDFSQIKFIPTQSENGASHQTLNYSFEHTDFAPGLNFYRLVQRDLDGTELVSMVVSVLTTNVGGISIQKVYPMPVTNELNIELSTVKNTKANLSILNITGAIVYQKQYDISKGTQQLSIQTNALPAGQYFVQIKSALNTSDVVIRTIKK